MTIGFVNQKTRWLI
jgi:hypothetical protein